jgi:hypothetical protein
MRHLADITLRSVWSIASFVSPGPVVLFMLTSEMMELLRHRCCFQPEPQLRLFLLPAMEQKFCHTTIKYKIFFLIPPICQDYDIIDMPAFNSFDVDVEFLLQLKLRSLFFVPQVSKVALHFLHKLTGKYPEYRLRPTT